MSYFRDYMARFDADASGYMKETNRIKQASKRMMVDNAKLGDSFQNVARDANRSASSISKITSSLKGMMGVTAVYALSAGFGNAIQSAMAMIETTNLFSVSMGNMAEESQEFVEQVHDAFGFDVTNIQSAVGNFTLLARSMGMSTEQAKVLGENTYKLAKDLSSLVNVPIAQTMADLRSGLVGQSETVYKYGIDVTEAGLKTEAMNQGITKSVRDMSQGEKMALRYATMIRQTTLAQGDFARTINTPANQLKILSERFVTLTRTIGTIFIPMLQVVLPYLNALLRLLTQVFATIAKLVGYEPPQVQEGIGNQMGNIKDDADSATDAVGGTTKALKEMKNATLGMDELNIMPEQTTAGGGGAGAGGGASILEGMDLPSYDDLMGSIYDKSNGVYDNMKKIVDKFKELSMPLINANWNILRSSIYAVWLALKPLSETIGSGLAYFYKEVIVPLGVWLIERGLPSVLDVFTAGFVALNSVLQALSPIGQSFIQNFIKPLGEFAGNLFVDTMQDIMLALYSFSDWCKENPESVRSMATTIGTLFGAFEILKLIAFIEASGGVVGALISIGSALKITDKLTMFATKITEIGKIFQTSFGVIARLLPLVLTPVGAGIALLIAGIILMATNWDEYGKPMFDMFMQTVDWLWEKHLKPLVDEFGNLANALVEFFKVIYEQFITPLKDTLGDELAPFIQEVFTRIVQVMGTAIAMAVDILKGFIIILTGIIQFLTGVFSGNWKLAWEGIVNIFKGIFTSIGGIVKGALNIVIDAVNALIRGIEKGLNGVITKINGMILKLNEAKSALGIKGWIYPIPDMSLPQIPKLASGGSLDSGSMFIAGEMGKAETIGSYKGKTTVMPLENTDFVQAMYEAVKSAMSEVDLSGQVIDNAVYLDGEKIYANQKKIERNRGVNLGMGVFAR